MSLRKFSQGRILPEPSEEIQKESKKKEWTPEDEKELEREDRQR